MDFLGMKLWVNLTLQVDNMPRDQGIWFGKIGLATAKNAAPKKVEVFSVHL